MFITKHLSSSDVKKTLLNDDDVGDDDDDCDEDDTFSITIYVQTNL